LAKDISIFTTQRKRFTVTSFTDFPRSVAKGYKWLVLGVQRTAGTDMAFLFPSLRPPCTALSQHRSHKENYLSSNNLKKEKHLKNSFPGFLLKCWLEMRYGGVNWSRKDEISLKKGRCYASVKVPYFVFHKTRQQ